MTQPLTSARSSKACTGSRREPTMMRCSVGTGGPPIMTAFPQFHRLLGRVGEPVGLGFRDVVTAAPQPRRLSGPRGVAQSLASEPDSQSRAVRRPVAGDPRLSGSLAICCVSCRENVLGKRLGLRRVEFSPQYRPDSGRYDCGMGTTTTTGPPNPVRNPTAMTA